MYELVSLLESGFRLRFTYPHTDYQTAAPHKYGHTSGKRRACRRDTAVGAQGPRASASPARARQVLLPSWGPAATAEILNKCYYGPYHGVRRVSTQTFCGNDTAVWHFICLYCILTQGCFFIAFRETDRGGQGDREEHRCEREASIDWLSPAHAHIRD